VNESTFTGQTPTFLAWRENHLGIVERLEALGGNMNSAMTFEEPAYWDELYTGAAEHSEWYSGWDVFEATIRPLISSFNGCLLEVQCISTLFFRTHSLSVVCPDRLR